MSFYKELSEHIAAKQNADFVRVLLVAAAADRKLLSVRTAKTEKNTQVWLDKVCMDGGA